MFPQVDYEYLETATDFVTKEVKVDDNRHLILATPAMLDYLAKAKTWYGDGTFKIAATSPFKQLFTLCFFAKSGQALKLLPGCFIFMQGKKKADYCKVIIQLYNHVSSKFYP